MTDLSDAMPQGGYIGSLLPPMWLKDNPVAASLCGGLDGEFDGRRLAIDQLKASKLIDTATGSDVDLLGALVGVAGRYSGESDDHYRQRIIATCQHGVGASTTPTLQQALAAAFGVPFVVQDGASAATFTVFALGPLAVPAAVMPQVRRLKVAGTLPTGFQRLPVRPKVGDSTGVVGASVAGATVTGGAGYLVALQ